MKREKLKRTNIKSTKDRFRLSVFRSLKHITAQIINDEAGQTLVYESSLKLPNSGSIKAAKEVGTRLAKKAKEQNVSKLVFDRGRYTYQGRIKALAEAVRENGIEI